MGASVRDILGVDETGDDSKIVISISDPNGAVVGSIRLYAAWQADGSIRAQLELRFADKPSAFCAPALGLGSTGYAPGRPGIMVKMEPRQSEFDPMRLSIDIPRQARDSSANVRDDKALLAIIEGAREAIQALRTRCEDPDHGYYCLHTMAAFGAVRKLADDGSLTELVALAAQSLHAQDTDS